MNRSWSFHLFIWPLFVIVPLFLSANYAEASVLYKSYIVRQDRGQEILCDPYIVGENEDIFNLLSQKGELAQENYTEFLYLFKKMNPHIRDLNRIRPGEHILVPIRKLPPDAFPERSGGIVTIPFVTISKVKQLLREHSDTHRIERGDCVSVLVARRFGAFGTEAYQVGVDLFQRANPDIADLNRIYVGQKIYIPHASIPKEPWFPSLLDPSGAVLEAEAFTTLQAAPESTVSEAPAAGKSRMPESPIEEAAGLINARLIQKGKYFFPSQGESDLELDLSRFPLLETEGGKKVILSETQIEEKMVNAVQSFWEDAQALTLSGGASLETVMDNFARVIPGINPHQSISFTDQGLDVTIQSRWVIARSGSDKSPSQQTAVSMVEDARMRLPDSIIRYLSSRGIEVKEVFHRKSSKTGLPEPIQNESAHAGDSPSVIRIDPSNPRGVISELVAALGFTYAQGVTISFPYGGFQVQARSDLVTGDDGKVILIDFGDLHGDAVKSITETGIPVLQMKKGAEGKSHLPLLLTALENPFRVNPTFPAVKDRQEGNVSLTFPGFLLLKGNEDSTLITHDGIDTEVIVFLKESGVRVITVPSEMGWI